MKTLDFARRYVRFDHSSPITGAFNIDYYPFLRKPMEAADDIRVKRLVIYKASSALGTVLGQIINLKRIVCDVGSQLMICQTDDDATTWAKTRGKEWVKSNADAMRLLSRDKYAMTNDLWLFRHKFLGITGPGINAAQSVQVRYVQSDEPHLEAYPEGRLVEFEKRMGGRWDRQSTHITTAPDAGREVDTFYLEGQQDECCFRCPKCSKLVWPLWDKEDLDRIYNGTAVFTEINGAVRFQCPHCLSSKDDTARARYDLVRDCDYWAQNPSAPIETRSFRWGVWFAHWISWRELLIEHRAAMAAAKLGNLKPLEDWTKKRLCKAWKPILPDFGDGKGANDYKLGDVWIVDEGERFMSADRQAGKSDEGEHFWNLVTQYDRGGNSRRLDYRKVWTWSGLDAMQEQMSVKNCNVYVDSGWESRSTFRECGKRCWFSTRGTDETGFMHSKRVGADTINFDMPYSPGELQSGVIGQKPDKAIRHRGSGVPSGWCWQFAMANPTLYGYLSALISGSSGRYFGIASDFPIEYREAMPAFIQVIENDKYGRPKKPIWKPVRATHPWDCEIMGLLGAIRAGYFPLSKPEPQTS